MEKFLYKAISKAGEKKEGVIEAENNADAINRIKTLGFYPTQITQSKVAAQKTFLAKASAKSKASSKKSNIKIPFFGIGTVKSKDMVLFTRQLATLIDADLPLVRSLTVLRDQLKGGAMKDVIAQLARDVESGSTLSESLARFPKVFSKLYINMIKAGEAGGVLEVVLDRLADFNEKSQRLAGRVRSALAYPVFVVLIAMTVLIVLMAFIVPRFMEIFAEVGTSLPALTVMLLNISSFFKSKWYVGVAFVIGIGFIFRFLNVSPKTKIFMDTVKLKIPIVGALIKKVSVARFARTLGTLVSSGVPILQALDITRDTAGNEVIAKAVARVHDSIREGESLAAPMEASGVFPLMVVNMVDVGEETGSLDRMLVKVADTYEEEVDTAVGALTSLLEPLLIVFMGVIVGFIVIAMFLPLVSLMSALGS
ncbi:MAG: type II secretion system F family protein [Candidatus Omnitrophota bacterium]